MNRLIPVLMLALLTIISTRVTAETAISLSEAIRKSGEHSFSIKSLRHDSLASDFDCRAARSNRMPTLSLTAYSNFVNELQSVNLGLRRVELGSKENYQADVRLSLPLFTGGRISGQIKLQKKLALLKASALESEILKNAYQTRKVYLSLTTAQSVLRSARASLNRIKTINGDVHNLFEAGMADSVDLLDADLALQKAEQMVDDRATAVRNASAALSRLLGLATNETISTTESVPSPTTEHYPFDFVSPSDIDRPELKALQAEIQASEIAERLSSANYFPTLSGFGGYSVGKPNKDLFNKTWNDFFIGGLTLNWEFNLGRKVSNNLQSARAATNSARMLRQDLEESLVLQANTALQNLKLAHRSYVVSQREFETATQKFRLAQEKQKAGRLSVNRLLELEDEVTGTEAQFRASMSNFYIAEADYLYAVGSPRIYGGL